MDPIIRDLDAAEESIKKILKDEDFLGNPEISADEAFAEIEKQYKNSLDLVDPDGNLLKSAKGEYKLFQEGYTHALRKLDLHEGLSKRSKMNLQRAKAQRKLAAGEYSQMVHDKLILWFERVVKIGGKTIADFPKIDKVLQLISKSIGAFKAWLEFGSEGFRFWTEHRMNLKKIINFSGDADSIPVFNTKTFLDLTHYPARVVNYLLQRLKNGKHYNRIKEIDELSSPVWWKTTLYLSGAMATNFIWVGTDHLMWLLSKLGMAPDSYCRARILEYNDQNDGKLFNDIPKYNKGGASESSQMRAIIDGKGDLFGYNGFKYSLYKDRMKNVDPEVYGQITDWFGNYGQLDTEGGRAKFDKFNEDNFDFNVPDWMPAYLDCESGSIGFKIWDREGTISDEMYEQEMKDLERAKAKYQEIYNKLVKEIPQEVKDQLTSQETKIKNAFDGLKDGKTKDEAMKLSKACRESMDLKSKACQELAEFIKGTIEKTTGPSKGDLKAAEDILNMGK